MNGGGGNLPSFPPSNGGDFLLSLIQNPHPHPHPSPNTPPQQSPAIDPAVAIMGPTIPISTSPYQANGHDHPPLHPHHHHPPPWSHTHSPPYSPNIFGLPHNPFPSPQTHYQTTTPLHFTNGVSLTDDLRRLGFPIEANNSVDSFVQPQELKFQFGSLPTVYAAASAASPEVLHNGDSNSLHNLKFNKSNNGFDRNFYVDPKVRPNDNNHDLVHQERRGVVGNFRSAESIRVPPGFVNKTKGKGFLGSGTGRKGLEVGGGDDRMGVGSGELGARNENLYAKRESTIMGSGERSNNRGNVASELRLPDQLDHPGPPSGSNLHSDVDAVGEQLADSLLLEDEGDDKNHSRKRHGPREKDARSSDSRGKLLLSQRARAYKRQMMCRRDIDSHSVPFLAIYQSLIPPEEEKLKQKQLLALLEKLVCKEWPTARLYIYGSCANSFGVSKSDIDVCLAMEEAELDKSKIIMKLADILQSDNLQNVQALTRARVPIVKLMDPVTGISCDICINNLLAVVNTKLLRDYANIDARLRQLAFIIKHWAKSRGVNETYHGTLSSYAYVLMCIHFLQQRRPAILPCLQEMETTYSVTVDNVDCAFFDQVEKLGDFGRRNRETIAHLVWGFFYYWAYCHDYANSVISVRTGSIISKRDKDWTRRIGNDRHLICIEDPFETSHDLGRVVDKHSIKVLREEFERAADIMQYDPNPCIKLFQPYVPS